MLSLLRYSAAIVLLGLLASFVEAQTAPDIAPGMSFESVLSTYGWPKGRSAAEAREIWVYENFQVIFDNGRVVSVSPIVPAKGQPKRTPTPTAKAPPPAKNIFSPLTPQPAGTAPPSTNSSGAPPARPGDRPFAKDAQTPVPTAATSPGSTLTRTMWPLMLLVAVFIVAGIMMSSRKRLASGVRQRAAKGNAAPPSPPSAPKTWQETIAARIAKAANPPPDAIAPGSDDEPPALLTELSPWLLERLEWKRFELLVALYFKATGVRAEATHIGADGGVDVQLYRPGEARPYAYVQCKAWEKAVGVKPVRELFGVMAANQVSEGVFVTTGGYSDDAREFAGQNRITAITGRDLIGRFNQLAPEARARILTKVTEGDYTTPTCPNCDLKMVLRETDSPFWGCRNYPRCSRTINVRKSRKS
jgi:restriction system protein